MVILAWERPGMSINAYQSSIWRGMSWRGLTLGFGNIHSLLGAHHPFLFPPSGREPRRNVWITLPLRKPSARSVVGVIGKLVGGVGEPQVLRQRASLPYVRPRRQMYSKS
jgi:hypothetical protein